MKNRTLYTLQYSTGPGTDPVLTEADKSAMLEGIKRNVDAVKALKEAGQRYQADDHPNFNWMAAFPLLKSHIAKADCAESASTAANSKSASGGAGKKRAGAAQSKPSAKRPATKPAPSRKKKT